MLDGREFRALFWVCLLAVFGHGGDPHHVLEVGQSQIQHERVRRQPERR